MHDEPTLTMRHARTQYFLENGFGDDGGYGSSWVDFKLGPIPFPIPNTAARKRAVAYHDLHHVLTGYATDFLGELEISSWEIGAGCKSFLAAWHLNLGGMGGGLFLAPKKSFRAFVRGRRSQSLYGLPLDALLDERVVEARARLGVPRDSNIEATPTDVALFGLASAVGVVLGAATLAAALPLVPLGLAVLAARRARATA
jgi:hypothetical protein